MNAGTTNQAGSMADYEHAKEILVAYLAGCVSEAEPISFGQTGDEEQQATMCILRHAGGESFPADEDERVIWEFIPFLVNGLSDARVDELLDSILFDVLDSRAYGLLAAAIRRRVDPQAMEAAIVDKIRSGDARVRQNARDLEYYVFGWDPDYAMSEAGSKVVRSQSG